MGLFDKIFEKKICDICGGEIGLLGNRKLENGNCCKSCAAKLSPFFSDRRSSTVEEIKQQLEYREANKAEVAKFNVTRTLGTDNTKILFDEDARRFVVTSARNLEEANPDVLDYSMVTGCDMDIQDSQTEEKREDKDGNRVSYVPPRYSCEYDFNIKIFVNHPYFDEIELCLQAVFLTQEQLLNTENTKTWATKLSAFFPTCASRQEAKLHQKLLPPAHTAVQQQFLMQTAAANSAAA